MSDEELFINCKAGNTEAFQQLYEKYSKPIFNYVYKMMGDYEASKDILQEAFLKMTQGTFIPKASFSSWFYKIATNLCYNELKKRKRTKLLGESIEFLSNISNDISKETEEKDLVEKIKSHLNSLSDDQRAVFCLRFYQDKSYEEIACILDIPIGTVRSRLHYAIKHLQNYCNTRGQNEM